MKALTRRHGSAAATSARSAMHRLGPMLLAACLAGCALGHPHRTLATGVDLAALRAELPLPATMRGQRLPAIAVYAPPPRPAAAAAGADAAAEPPEGLVFDAAVIRRELVEVLAATGLFAAVFPVGTEPQSEVFAAIDTARRRHGASLLVAAEIGPPRLVLEERDLVLPLLAWLVGPPGLWLHSHTYALEFDLGLKLYDLTGDRWLPELPVPPARASEALNFHERTSSLWTYLLTNVWPAPFCPVDEDKVAGALAARALAAPLARFLEHLAERYHGQIYTFAVQPDPRGMIEVVYPPADTEVYVLGGAAHLSFLVSAPPGRTIRRARLGERLVFPAPARAAVAGAGEDAPPAAPPPRLRLPLVTTQPLEPGAPLRLVVEDSAGERTECVLVALRRASPAGRTASRTAQQPESAH
ncbi:MAG: hypothetical protein KatS3mg102_0895 [Planctomycetota bacterium]|nr:MAG: hypothetical protein KatS3mg102_0895 [Planctomycetota bacterium]